MTAEKATRWGQTPVHQSFTSQISCEIHYEMAAMSLRYFDGKNAALERENQEEMGHEVSWDSLLTSHANQMIHSLPITSLPHHLRPPTSALHVGWPEASRKRFHPNIQKF